MRLAVFLGLSLTALRAQDSLRIVADENTVLVGRTLPLGVLVRDADGNPRLPGAVTWSVSNSTIATISDTGELRPVALGVVRVTARTGGLAAEVPIQTLPREVRMVPATATLTVGTTQQFRAEAVDANGAVIPNVAWTWLANDRNGNSSGAISVSNIGLVTAKGDGGALVRATYRYPEQLTGLQRDWVLSALVNVETPVRYQISRLLNSRERLPSSFELRSRASMLWGTDDGQLFFNANLDGTANGLLNWNNGAWRMVSAGGEPRFVSGSLASEFRTHSILPNGQILTWEDTRGNGTQLSRGDVNGLRPFLTENAPMAGTEGTSGIQITRNSTSTAGWVLVRASFRFPGQPQVYQGLFRGFGERVTELLLWDGRAVEDFPRGYTIDYDFGITNDGVAYYSLSNQGRRIFYRHDQERAKVIGAGDTLLGSTVAGLGGGRQGLPTSFVAENGDFVLAVTLQDGTQYFLRYTPVSAEPQSLRVQSAAGVLWHHPTAGSLLFANLPEGTGAFLWGPDGGLKPVQLLNTPLLGQTVQDIESGTVAANGEATLMLRTTASSMTIVRMSDPPSIIAKAGDRLPVTAPFNILSLVGGGRTGAPHVFAGGEPSSIAILEGASLKPIAAIGDRIFDTTPWSGAAWNQVNWTARKAPAGDLYFTVPAGIVRVPAGGNTPQMFLRFPLTVNNVQVANPSWVDANTRGDVFWLGSTSANDQRLFVTRNGTEHRQLLVFSGSGTTATTLEGKVASGVNGFALDDDGQVLTSLQFRNEVNQALYLWNGEAWQLLARQNETRINGQVVRQIVGLHRAGGRRLFTLLGLGEGSPVIAEWRGLAWEIAVNPTQVMPHGQLVGSVLLFDLNRNGDLFFLHTSGTPYLMVKRGDQFVTVANLYRPVAEKFLLRVTAIDFRDDGTAYFLGITSGDEVVLFSAKPL